MKHKHFPLFKPSVSMIILFILEIEPTQYNDKANKACIHC